MRPFRFLPCLKNAFSRRFQTPSKISKTTLGVRDIEARLVPSTTVYQRGFEPDTTAHDALSLFFDLCLMKTWDESDTDEWGPDTWSISAGVSSLLSATFSNRVEANSGHANATQSFGGQNQPLGQYPGFTGSSEQGTLGYSVWRAEFARYEDMSAVYHLAFDVPHAGATGSFTFKGAGLQGVADESWGLDNVTVVADTRVVSIGRLADAAEINQVAGAFRLTRTGSVSQPLSVNMATPTGSATAGANDANGLVAEVKLVNPLTAQE